jgi:uncharacterized membrane protein YfcA
VPSAKDILLLMLALIGVLFCLFWARKLTQRGEWRWPTLYQSFVGLLTDFFDTLGIGSFATTTALYRPGRIVADENLPGTLTVGHMLPTVIQAFIYITIVEVDPTTLVSMIAASVLGAWLGAGVVTRLPRRGVQIGMGIALLAAATLILCRLLGVLPDPKSGDVIGLDWGMLGIAVACNFVIGALMTIGVGAYAPILILVSLLGMNEKTAFPIMMGSCAFLMPVSGARFILAGRYDARAALGLTLGGVPAVLVAAFIVKELPLYYVRWGVVAIVVFTAISMLYSAWTERKTVGMEMSEEQSSSWLGRWTGWGRSGVKKADDALTDRADGEKEGRIKPEERQAP